MKRSVPNGAAAARAAAKVDCGLVAAYREGLALAAIAVMRHEDGIRIETIGTGEDAESAEAGRALARWWCRTAAEAERVTAAAAARLRRRQAPASHDAGVDDEAANRARDCVSTSAEQLGAILRSDEDLQAEAMNALGRVDAEIAKLQQCGGLKSVNQAYRSYRLAASARGERIVRYGEWMLKYRENLLRQVAATLRRI